MNVGYSAHGIPFAAAAHPFAVIQPLVFIHIPKTAGTSFRTAAERHFGSGKCCFDYGLYSEQTSELVRQWMLERTEPEEFRTRFHEQGLRFFSGHVAARHYFPVFGAERMVAFVREPRQRLASEYLTLKRFFGETRDFSAFFRQSRFVNRQSKMLDSGFWPALGLVGVTERYRESLAVLEQVSGLAIPALNENRSRPDTDAVHSLSEQECRELEDLNREDMILYRQACEQLDWRLALLDRDLPYTRGALLANPAGQVSGWLLPAPGQAPVSVEILIDGESYQTLTPKLPCPALGRLGYGPARAVSFSVNLPRGISGRDVSCRVTATGQPLPGLPLHAPD